MQLFYSTDIDGRRIFLSESESRHCIKVLRKQINDNVMVVDGLGNLYSTILVNMDPNNTILEIKDIKKQYGKRTKYLHIAISPTKSMDRLEWFLEKVVELGVDEITFIECNNSERFKVNIARCKKIIISAIKQSVKAYLPKLNDLVKFDKFMIQNHHVNVKSICFLGLENSTFISNLHDDKRSHLICIGPEGDFTENEVSLAIKNNFNCISLGNSRLRTETAGVVVATMINLS